MVPLFGTVMGGLAAFFWASALPQKFQAHAVIRIERDPGEEMPMDEYAVRMVSTNSLRRVGQQLGLMERWKVGEKEMIAKLRDSVRTRSLSGTDLVEIRARHANPEHAGEIVDSFIKQYLLLRDEIDRREARQVILSLKAALRDQEEEVEAKKEALSKYLDKDSSFFEALHSNPRAIEQYDVAKQELETSQRLLAKLKEDLRKEESHDYVPKIHVQIHEQTHMGDLPVYPDKKVWTLVGAVSGFLLACPFALLLAWLEANRSGAA